MAVVWLGLGANRGEPLAQLQTALTALRSDPRMQVTAISSLYRTKPVDPAPGEPQADYLNAVVGLETDWSARELLQICLTLETRAGRHRTQRNAARELDVDILFYGQDVIRESDLVIPHPRLADRAFVVVPMAEIAPTFWHPVLDTTMAVLATRVVQQGVVRIAAAQDWAG